MEENLKVLAGLHRVVSGLRYDVARRVPAPDGVLQQHVLRGTLPNGAAVELHAAMYLRVRDGHVTGSRSTWTQESARRSRPPARPRQVRGKARHRRLPGHLDRNDTIPTSFSINGTASN